MKISILGLGMALSCLIGCQDKDACEKSRLEAHRVWGEVHKGAIRQRELGDNAKKWAAVEKKTGVLSTAFMTEQITWASADAARDELEGLVGGVESESSADAKFFHGSLAVAVEKYEEFAKSCR